MRVNALCGGQVEANTNVHLDGSRVVAKRTASRAGQLLDVLPRPGSVAGTDAGANLGTFETLGTVVRLRPGQKLVRPNEASDTTFLIKEGVFVSESVWPGLRSAVLALHYAGDVLPLAALPQAASSAAVAATQAEVVRISGTASLAEAGALASYVQASLLDQQARMALHIAMVTTLDAGQRVASLLAEFALRLGRQNGRGFAFDAPLSRNGMADYLGLNADTLSRIVSSLKASGGVEQPGRHRFIIRDWKAFFNLSPLNASIDALHRQARG